MRVLSLFSAALLASAVAASPSCPDDDPSCTLSLPSLSRQSSALLSALSQGSINSIADLSTATINEIIEEARVGNPNAGTPGEAADGGGGGSGTSQSSDGDRYGGAGLTYDAASGKATSTLVMLHGLSADVGQVAPLVGIAQRGGMQNTRFILPQAPDKYVNYRRKTEPSWFNIDGTDAGAKEHPKEILASVKRVEDILKGEKKKGVKRVAVLGMSQGGAVASTLFMRGSVKLDGCVLLATWLPLAGSYPKAATDASKGTPALMVHGGADPTVELQWAEDSAEVMRKSGRTVDFQVEPDAPHIFGLKLFSVATKSMNYLKKRGIK